MASSGWNGQASVAYSYDANGNLLGEDGRLAVTTYKYNGQNRMVYSRVVDKLKKTVTATRYEYDSFGRRIITQEEGSDTMKTLYDSFTFEIIKESSILANGLFTDKYNTGIQYSTNNNGTPTGDRYRYIEDEVDDSRYRYIEDSVYELQTPRFTGTRAVLYGNGSPVAVNRGSSTSSSTSSNSESSGGFYAPTSSTRYTNTSYLQDNISYLGTDILGSVRSITSSYGTVESESTYDVFGTPITGTYTAGVDFGYLGKPYDTATGLYNYGYRDYSPNAARFTTIDPIKDGSNWFVYVNNDPINYVDLCGLCTSPADTYATQKDARDAFGIQYNDDSIREDKEYGTTIYKDSNGNYYYGQPNQGDQTTVSMYSEPRNPNDTPVEITHTHSRYSNGSEDLSEGKKNTDKNTANEYGIPVSVVTPGGRTIIYDPEKTPRTKDEVYVNPNTPSDPNAGSDRQTSVDPSTGQNNPYTPKEKAPTPPAIP